jgi:aminoglycoside 2''-phosphotransferase
MMDSKHAGSLFSYLCKRHPELSGESYRVLSSSLQNMILIVGERLIFRFPLTSDLTSMRLEQRILPKLAKHVPLPIPQFQYVSGRKDKICYVVYPMIPGEPLEAEHLQRMGDRQRLAAAKQIAEFLTALHTFDGSSFTRVDSRELQTEWRKNWSGYYRALELHVFPKIGRKERLWIMTVFYKFLYPSEHFRFQPCLLHGDFKNDHIFCDPATGKLTGVIDFGNMRMGDPAYDFHDLCFTFGEPFMREVASFYRGPLDRTFLQRVTGFYTHILRLSSLYHSVLRKDWEKFARRLEWLKEKTRELDD